MGDSLPVTPVSLCMMMMMMVMIIILVELELWAKILSEVPLVWNSSSSTYEMPVGNEIVDNSDVVGASPVGAAPTSSSFST